MLAEGDGWKVKRLVVRPHARLSLQSHQHRSEHWTVLAGVASCQVDSVPTEVRVGDEVHVPCGSTHRIANTGEEWLEIVELQLGDYLGEDDIVRLEDDYGRC